jgi:hypothetical protein
MSKLKRPTEGNGTEGNEGNKAEGFHRSRRGVVLLEIKLQQPLSTSLASLPSVNRFSEFGLNQKPPDRYMEEPPLLK